MTNINKQVRFNGNIEVIDNGCSSTSSGKRVHFAEQAMVTITLNRDDFTETETRDYWLNDFDMWNMKREMIEARISGDPTLHKYQKKQVQRITAVIRKSHDAVFEEQNSFRQHQQEHKKGGECPSKALRVPCFWCVSHEYRVALAYRLATLESKSDALSEGLVLQNELFDGDDARVPIPVPPTPVAIQREGLEHSHESPPVAKRKFFGDTDGEASSRKSSLKSPNRKTVVAASA